MIAYNYTSSLQERTNVLSTSSNAQAPTSSHLCNLMSGFMYEHFETFYFSFYWKAKCCFLWYLHKLLTRNKQSIFHEIHTKMLHAFSPSFTHKVTATLGSAWCAVARFSNEDFILIWIMCFVGDDFLVLAAILLSLPFSFMRKRHF